MIGKGPILSIGGGGGPSGQALVGTSCGSPKEGAVVRTSARTVHGNGGGALIGKGPILSTGGGGAPSGQALSGTSIRSSGFGVEPGRAIGARYG